MDPLFRVTVLIIFKGGGLRVIFFISSVYTTLRTIENFNKLECKSVFLNVQSMGQAVALGPSLSFLKGVNLTARSFIQYYLKYLNNTARADSGVIYSTGDILIVTVRELK